MTAVAAYLLDCEAVYRAPFDNLYWFMLLSGFRELELPPLSAPVAKLTFGAAQLHAGIWQTRKVRRIEQHRRQQASCAGETVVSVEREIVLGIGSQL